MIEQLRGTGVALVTPFNNSGEVDFEAYGKVMDHCIKGKVEYLVVLGTTGETATLTDEEKMQVFEFATKHNKGRVPLVAGLGGNDTIKLGKQIADFNIAGYDAILSASPYYNKPNQEGIYQHYKYIASKSNLPIILYNVPGRTSSNITAETTLRIAADMDNIIGIKEASGNLEQCMKIVKNKPKDFLVISGDDILTLPMMSFGVEGVISVAANAFPKQMSEMVRFALKGKFAEAKTIHLSLIELIDLLFTEGNPAGVKSILNLMGICNDTVRLPLIKGSNDLREKFKRYTIQLS